MKVLIAGDFCPTGRIANILDKGNYASVFSDVKDIIMGADYSIVNFECPIVIGESQPIIKHGPSLKCDRNGMDAIKWIGFDCVTLANNHFYDFGENGVACTLKACAELGIDCVGGGKNLLEASNVLYKDILDSRVAIINCCENEFSIATDKSGGSNPLNPIQQYYAIQEAREKAAYVLVIIHGGHENWQLPSPRMVETYRFFIDAGADAVVNHHQHCYSGFEVYEGKPIFYGLGNFCFDNSNHRNDLWNEGYMIMLNLCEKPSFEIIPYIQCGEQPKVEVLKDAAFDTGIRKLNEIISNPALLDFETEEHFRSSVRYNSSIFEPVRNRLYLACKQRGWFPSLISRKRKLQAKNAICCESHRDELLFWLNE